MVEDKTAWSNAHRRMNSVREQDAAITGLVSRTPARTKPASARPPSGKPVQAWPAQEKLALANPAQARSTQARSTQARPTTQARQTLANPAQAKTSQARPTQAKTTKTQPAEAEKCYKNWFHGICSTLMKKNPKTKPTPAQDSNASTKAGENHSATRGKQKTTFWIFSCCMRSNHVSPSTTVTPTMRMTSPTHREQPMPMSTKIVEKKQDLQEKPKVELQKSQRPVESRPEVEAAFIRAVTGQLSILNILDFTVDHLDTDRFGFPNLGQSCYMNSSLQSLLTLHGFIKSIESMKHIWSSVPGTQLLRSLYELSKIHATTETSAKVALLYSFQEAVSTHAPEFEDNLQKDAHEFLNSVLVQVHNLAPQLQKTATKMVKNYICPVEEHLMFRMENIRTCKSCGVQSIKHEDFTNLSLDLVPGGTTEDLLNMYMKEVEVEFRCDCGGTVSSQRSTFKTLPNILILHLKRFRYTSYFEQQKLFDSIKVQRDIVVSSRKGGGCYSLVSMICHFGSHHNGHYVCDSVHPHNQPDEPNDHWLTYNDKMVNESVSCPWEQRQNSAYILFYKRHS